jgi:hypothetical protein
VGAVVEVDFRMRWRKPVYVGDGDWLTEIVVGPAEAIAFLKDSFRFRDGESYSRAWQSCHDAVEGRVEPATARKHFVTAYADDCVRSSWESHEIKTMEGEF